MKSGQYFVSLQEESIKNNNHDIYDKVEFNNSCE